MKFCSSAHVGTDEDVLHDTNIALRGTFVADQLVRTSNCEIFIVPFEVLGSVQRAADVPSPQISGAVQRPTGAFKCTWGMCSAR